MILAALLFLLLSAAAIAQDAGLTDSGTTAPDSGRLGRVTVEGVEVETHVCGCRSTSTGTPSPFLFLVLLATLTGRRDPSR